MPLSPARRVAFDVLRKVDQGAHAMDTLLRHAKDLDSRDAGLAWQLVFGVLRFRGQLDFLADAFAGRKLVLENDAANALRMGVFQIRYLKSIPLHAAVMESVEFMKRAHKRSSQGLVNAVLRKVNRGQHRWPERSIELSCPPWLLESWDRQYGTSGAFGIAKAALDEPPVYVRVPHGVDAPEGLLSTRVAGAYKATSPQRHGFRIHDAGAQAIVPLLDLQPGNSFLDLCAAPGNKTAQALETPHLRAVACDLKRIRLESMENMNVPLVVLDATRPLPFGQPFDRILVDAPCSGTGTLGRNPEIKWRLKPEDLGAFAKRQQAILNNALDALAPGGKLVYSTCSLEREENEAVVEAVLSAREGVALRQSIHRLPGRDEGDGFFAAILERPC